MFDTSDKYMRNADQFAMSIKKNMCADDKSLHKYLNRQNNFKIFLRYWHNKNKFANSFDSFFNFYRFARKHIRCMTCDKINNKYTNEELQNFCDKQRKIYVDKLKEIRKKQFHSTETYHEMVLKEAKGQNTSKEYKEKLKEYVDKANFM